MTAVADKRSAFAWIELRALDRIDLHTPKNDRRGVHAVYGALARVAAERWDHAHQGFEAARALLLERSSVADRTLTKHLRWLQQLGLVEVEMRVAASGQQLPSRYRLVDSPDPAAPVASPAAIAPPAAAAPPAARSASIAPPTRASGSGGEKEEGERERARANPDIQGIGSGIEDHAAPVAGETRVFAELAPLLAERGRELTARDRLAIRGVLGQAPEDVDPVAAAERLAAAYGAGGKAERRPIANIARLLETEIGRSAPAAAPGPAAGRRPRRRRARKPPAGGIRWARPAAIDPPAADLEQAWQQAAGLLRDGMIRSSWELWLRPVKLAGTTPAGEICLETGEPNVDYVASRFGRVVREALERALERPVEVAFVPPAPRKAA